MKGRWTKIKQDDLYNIFKTIVCAGNAILNKWVDQGWADDRFWIFDLNAGPGRYEDNLIGSPLLLLNILKQYTQRKCNLILIENNYNDKKNFERLMTNLEKESWPERITIMPLNMDQQKALPYFYDNTRKKRFGLCYQDFSGIPDFKILSEFSQVACYCKCDILINCNTGAMKRLRESLKTTGFKTGKETREPIEALKDIDKQYWQVRKPLGSWQWQMFLGTNWPAMQRFKKLGFERLNNGKSRSM